MEILIEYGLFVLKAFTIIVLIFIPIFFLVSTMRQPPETNESLKLLQEEISLYLSWLGSQTSKS